MKIGCFGDLHITDKKPRNRTDENYLETLCGKILWACENPLKECEVILQPGDVFDSFKANDFLKQHIIPFLKALNKQFHMIYGQHDLRFHNSNKLNTPLRVAEVSGALNILGKTYEAVGPMVDAYGASWGEEIPEIENPEYTNILVIHKMIIKDEKLWEAQTGHTMAQILLRKNKFDLIVSGDNHQCFTDQHEDKWLVNMGSLMRSTIAQLDHCPSVAVYDTKTREVEVTEIPVKPSEEVFRIEEALAEKEKSEQLEAFIEKLEVPVGGTVATVDGLDFRANLEAWISENSSSVDNGVVEIIKEATDAWIK
jgi:predicted phosphodiesterase